MSTVCLHATTIALNETAVLIRGASGSGKSSLALQILETAGTGLRDHVLAASLVADDQTELVLRSGQLFASPPKALEGLIEVRGQGILKVAFLRELPLVLVVDLKPAASIERLPDERDLWTEILGVALPRVAIDPAHFSAVTRLRVAWALCKKL
jgi:HPr kinase/phosphorylase